MVTENLMCDVSVTSSPYHSSCGVMEDLIQNTHEYIIHEHCWQNTQCLHQYEDIDNLAKAIVVTLAMGSEI